MNDAAQLNVLLDGLAQAFEKNERVALLGDSSHGWGQFLDAPARHTQVGLYGTSAGIIVRALAGRGNMGALSSQVNSLTNHWWTHKNESPQDRTLSQITRLAFFNLALRISQSEYSADVEDLLRGRMLAERMWGNYWFSQELHDPTPRLFPTAIALLSLALFKETIDQSLSPIATALEEKLLGSDDLSRLHFAVASAAILAAKGDATNPAVRKLVKRAALEQPSVLADLGVYFYEHEYREPTGGSSAFARDYFIVPAEIMLALAGFQRGAPNALRERAERTVQALIKNLRENNGLYRPGFEQRLTSKNQAWAAVLLKGSLNAHNARNWFSRVAYDVRRSRPENKFTRTVWPVFVVAFATAANAISTVSVVDKTILAIGLLVVGSLYGKNVIRIFPGKE